MTFWQNIFFAFWFFLPAGMANMFASFSGLVPKLCDLDYPLDLYLNFRGRRVFGSHKTVRGLIVGVVAAIILAVLLHQPVALGFLLGLGAILGDAAKSFVKRQFDIAPGHSFLFFDQLDFILGGILFSSFYTRLTLVQYGYIILVYFLLHVMANLIGFKLGLKSKPI